MIALSASDDEFAQMLEQAPSIPTVVAELLSAMDDANVSLNDVADLMCHDVTLSLRALQAAQSPLFAMRTAPTTVADAVRRLGYRRVRDLVMTVGMAEVFRSPAQSSLFRRLWQHSITSAVVAGELAARCDNRAGDATLGMEFLSGLCHDIGRFVVVSFFGSDLQAQANTGSADSYFVDSEHRELDHAELGALVLERWHMPAEIVEATRDHHKIEANPVECSYLACVVGVAEKLAETPENTPYECIESITQARVWQRLGLRPDEVPGLLEEARPMTMAALSLLEG